MNNLPNEIFNNIKEYVIFKPKTYQEVNNAINLWFDNNQKSNLIYGHFSNWDLSNFNLYHQQIIFNNFINNYEMDIDNSQNNDEYSDEMSNYSYFDDIIMSDDEDDFNDHIYEMSY